ncbi:MAG: hypothetical protein NTZ50_16480 [Chloroflexi bacterium]|nr:hypothetical protein [Chloroflexota bacterium]
MRSGVDRITSNIEAELRKQHAEIEQLTRDLATARATHINTKAELDATKQQLSNALEQAVNWQKRFHEEEAKSKNAPQAVATQWLEELGKSQLISGLDRVISGEAQSDPADFRKRLVTWFGRRVNNAKPEDVIAVGRQFVEKDSKAAAQIAWSPDTPFRDDVDAVEVEITYAGLRFGEIVIERARGTVVNAPIAAEITSNAEARPDELPTSGTAPLSPEASNELFVPATELTSDENSENRVASEVLTPHAEDVSPVSASMVTPATELQVIEPTETGAPSEVDEAHTPTLIAATVDHEISTTKLIVPRPEYSGEYSAVSTALSKIRNVTLSDAEISGVKAFVGYLFGVSTKGHSVLLGKHPIESWPSLLKALQSRSPRIREEVCKACKPSARSHIETYWPDAPQDITSFNVKHP